MFPGQREKQVSPKPEYLLQDFLLLPRKGTSSSTPSPSPWDDGNKVCLLLAAVGKATTSPVQQSPGLCSGSAHPFVPGAVFPQQILEAAIAERSAWESSTVGQTQLGGCQHRDLAWEAAEGPGEFVSAECCYGLAPATLGCSLSCREQVIFQQLPNDLIQAQFFGDCSAPASQRMEQLGAGCSVGKLRTGFSPPGSLIPPASRRKAEQKWHKAQMEARRTPRQQVAAVLSAVLPGSPCPQKTRISSGDCSEVLQWRGNGRNQTSECVLLAGPLNDPLECKHPSTFLSPEILASSFLGSPVLLNCVQQMGFKGTEAPVQVPYSNVTHVSSPLHFVRLLPGVAVCTVKP